MVTIAIIIVFYIPTFAFGESNDVQNEGDKGTIQEEVDEPNLIEIKSGDLPFSGDWKKQVNEIGENILTQLKTKPVDEYEKVIAKASVEEKKNLQTIYEAVVADVVLEKGKLDINENNEVTNTNVPLAVLDEEAYQQLTSVFVIYRRRGIRNLPIIYFA